MEAEGRLELPHVGFANRSITTLLPGHLGCGESLVTQKLSAGNQALLDNGQKAQLDALRGVAGRGVPIQQ